MKERPGLQVRSKYGCPFCGHTKTDEKREWLPENVLEIVVFYDKCFIKYHKQGAIWKKIAEYCERDLKR